MFLTKVAISITSFIASIIGLTTPLIQEVSDAVLDVSTKEKAVNDVLNKINLPI